MSHQTAQVLEKKVKFLAERTGLETKEGESPSTPTIPEFRTRFRTTSKTLGPTPPTQNPPGYAIEFYTQAVTVAPCRSGSCQRSAGRQTDSEA
jgi:hypothetical protein